MECIPDEVLFEILLCLRAQDIYSGAMLVCRKWYHIIHTHNFISTHLQQATTYGLLIDDEQGGVDFISVRNGDIETYKLMNCKIRRPLWNSCNGLVLEEDGSFDSVYCVANISTHQSLRLPPCPGNPWTAGMGYAAASGTYKVFAVCGKWWGIISVGVDKSWRFISAEHLSPSAVMALCLRPLVTEGYMHWIGVGPLLVTLNVETETITEAPLTIPEVIGGKNRSIHCLSTGKYLSLLIYCGELVWKVWEMKLETGDWRKLPNICLESEKGRMEGLGFSQNGRLSPCGWVKYPEVLAFKFICGGRSSLCFYNIVKREISSYKADTGCSYRLLLHKNSLVSPVGWKMLS